MWALWPSHWGSGVSAWESSTHPELLCFTSMKTYRFLQTKLGQWFVNPPCLPEQMFPLIVAHYLGSGWMATKLLAAKKDLIVPSVTGAAVRVGVIRPNKKEQLCKPLIVNKDGWKDRSPPKVKPMNLYCHLVAGCSIGHVSGRDRDQTKK